MHVGPGFPFVGRYGYRREFVLALLSANTFSGVAGRSASSTRRTEETTAIAARRDGLIFTDLQVRRKN